MFSDSASGYRTIVLDRKCFDVAENKTFLLRKFAGRQNNELRTRCEMLVGENMGEKTGQKRKEKKCKQEKNHSTTILKLMIIGEMVIITVLFMTTDG